MAKVIKEFKGIPDSGGGVHTFKVGDEVEEGSDLERVAIEQGWCKRKDPPKNKAMPPLRNKSGVVSLVAQALRKGK